MLLFYDKYSLLCYEATELIKNLIESFLSFDFLCVINSKYANEIEIFSHGNFLTLISVQLSVFLQFTFS